MICKPKAARGLIFKISVSQSACFLLQLCHNQILSRYFERGQECFVELMWNMDFLQILRSWDWK